MDIARLRGKLEELRRRDLALSVFGSATHRYQLNEPISERVVAKLEKDQGVLLPDDYRDFILRMGNGGAGPSYGVFPFGKWDGAGAELESWVGKLFVVSDLRADFPLSEEWRLPEERLNPPETFESDEHEDAWGESLDEELYPATLTRGWFPVCHHGCALRTYLVVSGAQRGQVWSDERAEGGPVTPHLRDGKRLSFSEWYEGWLDDSLRSLSH